MFPPSSGLGRDRSVIEGTHGLGLTHTDGRNTRRLPPSSTFRGSYVSFTRGSLLRSCCLCQSPGPHRTIRTFRPSSQRRFFVRYGKPLFYFDTTDLRPPRTLTHHLYDRDPQLSGPRVHSRRMWSLPVYSLPGRQMCRHTSWHVFGSRTGGREFRTWTLES